MTDRSDQQPSFNTGTHEALGNHGARLASLEGAIVQLGEDMNRRLNAQDKVLGDIKDLVAFAKGGIWVLAKIGTWAVGIAAIIHAIPSLLSAIRGKP
jgi:hypothetical protein